MREVWTGENIQQNRIYFLMSDTDTGKTRRTPVSKRCLFFFFSLLRHGADTACRRRSERERERSETLWREIWARKAAKREKEREGSESADGIGGYKSLAAIIEHSRSCGFDSFQLFYSLFLIIYICMYIYVCILMVSICQLWMSGVDYISQMSCIKQNYKKKKRKKR